MELIICEKPAAARRIAFAIGEKVSMKRVGRVPYFEFETNGKKGAVAGAVGHMYGLAEVTKSRGYPVFDLVWKPIFEISRKAAFAKAYWNALKALAKKADRFVIACDYDVEGELIGLNILRFICGVEDAPRMKFSTLTKAELRAAYAKPLPSIDWGQALAGETRHFLDWYWGINLSRALMSALSEAGLKKVLSIGRVQGPALKAVVDREREIEQFKPKPFWELFAKLVVGGKTLVAAHLGNPFWERAVAEERFGKARQAFEGKVEKIEKTTFAQLPPPPFDLTTLQTEAYRCFGLSPKATLAIAQDLYLAGLISYPRTASQKLPPTIGYKAIIQALAKQKAYAKACSELLAGPLKPVQGKAVDPAHPAIFPTGNSAKLKGSHAALYDLIVRRFLACFAEPALRERQNVLIDISGEKFKLEGLTTLKSGWLEIYTYFKPKELALPELEEGRLLKVTGLELKEDSTKPPARYSPASLVKDLERRALGTKATRAEIVDTLYRRGYIAGEAIRPTKLGRSTIAILEKFCSKVIDEALTRHFEQDMEAVARREKSKDAILSEAREVLIGLLKEFDAKKAEIGASLMASIEPETLGSCKCGGKILIRIGRYGRFAACSGYPKCKVTFPLPKRGAIFPVGRCSRCGSPLLKLARKGKGAFEFCINPKCK